MRSQNATAYKRNVRFLPYAFTENGAIMAANVLNSPEAVRTSVFVVRAFVQMGHHRPKIPQPQRGCITFPLRLATTPSELINFVRRYPA